MSASVLDIAQRSQRDLYANTSVALLPYLGTKLEPHHNISDFLNLGVTMFDIDVAKYISNSTANMESMVSELSSYLTTSNTNLDTDCIVVKLSSVDDLVSSLLGPLSNWIYTNNQLAADRMNGLAVDTNGLVSVGNDSWPVLSTLLFQEGKRLIITSNAETSMVFNLSYPWSFTYSNDIESVWFQQSIPIADSSSITNTSSIWSWAEGQPFVSAELAKSSDGQTAYKCATMFQGRWTVSDCYDEFRVLCSSGPSNWTVSRAKHTYFATDCPPGYDFDVPKAPWQMELVNELAVNEPIWIDLNSISIDHCWVTGGPFALCPYTVASSHQFIVYITPVSVISFVLITLIFLLNLRQAPIQKNRKRWKKLIRPEVDGVPA